MRGAKSACFRQTSPARKPITMSDMTNAPPSTGFTRHIPLIVIAVAAVLGVVFLRDHLGFETLSANREALLAFRDSNFTLMAVLFVLVYVVIVAFSLPGAAVASITGGFLFGLVFGTILNVVAATIGASLIFLAARAGLGQMLAQKMDASDGKLAKLRAGLLENEISVLFLLRLVPAVPFFVANLLPALVGVKFRNYVLTTALGIIPGAIVFTWIGVGVGGVFDRGETPDLSLIWDPNVLGPILGPCVLAALPIVIKAVRGKPEA